MFEESAKLLVWLIPVVLLALIILPQMVRILREYERGVIFRLGKLLGAKGPGLILLDQIRTLDRSRLVRRLGAVSAQTLRITLATLREIFDE